VGRIPRVWLGLVALAIGGLLLPAQASATPRFRFGVAAGEISARSVVIWGALNDAATVRAEVAKDSRFRRVVSRERVDALATNDFTVEAPSTDLRPNTAYRYRFCTGGRCSQKGRFETAPRPAERAKIRFAYTGDTDATAASGETVPFFGRFAVFNAMRREANDFNIHLGDTIYSDSQVPGSPFAATTEEKWGKYKLNLREEPLRRLRAAAGVYTHWDDHEFVNDFSIPEHGAELYGDGVRAFLDYAPVTFEEADGLYRSFRWGRNLELFFLVERSFRDAKVSATDVCDNPDTPGEPDLAPTAPQNVRDAFAILIPSLANPVSQECKDAINDPDRSLLGEAQLETFLDEIEASDATWKVVVNETPIQQFYGLPYDRWEGYAYERVELLNQLEQRGVENVVFISTDTHAAFANVIRLRTLAGDVAPANAPAEAPADTAYSDFVAGPVATATFWTEIDEITSAGSGQLLSQAFFKPAPPSGVGMRCAQGDTDSYAVVTVRSTRLRVAYRDAHGDPVRDVDDTRCGPYTLQP
jgi:alkaline phosphatase D